MSKNNVHPDHYKTAGRDRQDDAAAARQAMAVKAKASSRERPDRMAKGPYFQRPEPAAATPAAPPAVKAKASVTQRKTKASALRTRRKPAAPSPAKKKAAVTRRPAKKR